MTTDNAIRELTASEIDEAAGGIRINFPGYAIFVLFDRGGISVCGANRSAYGCVTYSNGGIYTSSGQTPAGAVD